MRVTTKAQAYYHEIFLGLLAVLMFMVFPYFRSRPLAETALLRYTDPVTKERALFRIHKFTPVPGVVSFMDTDGYVWVQNSRKQFVLKTNDDMEKAANNLGRFIWRQYTVYYFLGYL